MQWVCRVRTGNECGKNKLYTGKVNINMNRLEFRMMEKEVYKKK